MICKADSSSRTRWRKASASSDSSTVSSVRATGGVIGWPVEPAEQVGVLTLYKSVRRAKIEGVLYPSSLTNQTVYAFYERVLEVASPFPRLPIVHRALGDPTLLIALKNACRSIGYVIAPKEKSDSQ